MGIIIGIGETKPQYPYDYYYGIEWDTTVSNPKCTRIGKMELHKELPIQNKMRRCLLNDDGTVRYYLDPDDSTKTDTGSTAKLDGSQGQVMVELPDVYIKFEMEGTKRRCLISEYPLPGFKLWKKNYVSAYEAALQRSAKKLCSVINMDPDYRGGNNDSSKDGKDNTLLGRHATAISTNDFRFYARNRGKGWEILTYNILKKIWWLYAVEYANFNSQDSFNEVKTEEGFMQGGLGSGLTTFAWKDWSDFSGYYPVIGCGITNNLGNKSGEVSFSLKIREDTEKEYKANSYRGIEIPFGHTFKWVDGCIIVHQTKEEGGKSLVYVTDDPEKWGNFTPETYKCIGEVPRVEGYIKEMFIGEDGDMLPRSVGGSASTYFCDYFYTNAEESPGISVLASGGSAPAGSAAGLALLAVDYSAASANATYGSRLCFEKA